MAARRFFLCWAAVSAVVAVGLVLLLLFVPGAGDVRGVFVAAALAVGFAVAGLRSPRASRACPRCEAPRAEGLAFCARCGEPASRSSLP